MKTQCVYCGTSNPETKDHIPPKNLFPQPRPELVTVPCCEKCHKPTSLDDEIFRNMLTMSRNAEYHPDIPKILDKVHRSFERPEHLNMVKSLIATIEKVDLVGSSKENYSYRAEVERMDKVVSRIVRGLFWHENRKIYPIEGQITVYCLEFINFDNRSLFNKYNHIFIQTPTKTMGNKVFQYKIAKLSEEYLEMWWMCFYESIIYYAFLIPHSKNEK